MKTYNELLEMMKRGMKDPKCIDGRDLNRLCMFLSAKDLIRLGLDEKDLEGHKPIEYTRKNVLKQLKEDVDFAFEKALNKRGISSSLMFEVIRMWNYVLEEGLENWSDDDYAMYGLPLYKATALKYGFDNPIGDDTGSEEKYNSH